MEMYCADCMKSTEHILEKDSVETSYYECSICGYENPMKKDVPRLSSRRIFTKPDIKKKGGDRQCRG